MFVDEERGGRGEEGSSTRIGPGSRLVGFADHHQCCLGHSGECLLSLFRGLSF